MWALKRSWLPYSSNKGNSKLKKKRKEQKSLPVLTKLGWVFWPWAYESCKSPWSLSMPTTLRNSFFPLMSQNKCLNKNIFKCCLFEGLLNYYPTLGTCICLSNTFKLLWWYFLTSKVLMRIESTIGLLTVVRTEIMERCYLKCIWLYDEFPFHKC